VSLLIPQALPLSIPAGVCLGIVSAMWGRRPTGRKVLAVMIVAAAAAFIVWTTMEWGLPAANQRFREICAARFGDGIAINLEPGMNELGLTRLGQRTDLPAVRQFHLLWALVFATIPLASFALGLSVRVYRLSLAIVAGLASCAAYVMLMSMLDYALPTALPAIVAIAWMPDIVFLLAGVALLRSPTDAPA
jgi:lipopolysaccharide export LptBFGC system permease protein LptF